jgi:hypothetical protein
MRLGFDVSQFNPQIKSVPWYKARFGCVRLTSGLSLDTLADEHLRRASGEGVADLLGYGYVKGSLSGEAQARCLIDRAHALEDELHLGALALAVDVEDPLGGPPWHRPTYAKILVDCVENLDEHAPLRRGLLYVSPAFWAELVKHAPHVVEVARFLGLWLADWTPPANVPPPWPRWDIWQNEVTEVAAGVEIDHDLHNGTAEDWRRTMFRDEHDELGGIVTTTQRASGHGPGGVEDFQNTEPTIDTGDA